MSNLLKKHLPLALAVALIFIMVFSIAFMFAQPVSGDSTQTVNKISQLSVGHVSDIHYFPLEYSYQDVNAEDYKMSDFYYSMTGDTKLVLESGVIFNSMVTSIIADARAGTAPTYLVASGDLSKNGERYALIDVANTLRYLQNEVRKVGGKYADFQVFATPGNHDLYNGAGALYDKETGKQFVLDGISAAQFALIFAGLGYPDANLTGADGAVRLLDFFPEDYWSTQYTDGYQCSENAENINFHYFNKELADKEYFKIGDENNVLSFAAELKGDYAGYSLLIIDASDREIAQSVVAVRICKDEFDLKYAEADKFAEAEFYPYDSEAGAVSDTKFTDAAAVQEAFAANEPVYINSGYDHLTGGRITESCLNWLRDYTSRQKGDNENLSYGVEEETYIATFHQNILPHFTQEDDILKDFTLYNWEYTAKQFLKMGIRYCLTGHMHSSDTAVYTDAQGRTLYDLETGSMVSYDAPRRYMSLTRNNCDGKLGEQFSSSLHILESIREFASDHITTAADWNQSAFDAKYAPYKEFLQTLEGKETLTDAEHLEKETLWKEVVATNPDYFTYMLKYEDMSTMSFNEYINQEIYGQLIERLLDHFLNDRLIASLPATVENMLVGGNNVVLQLYGGMLNKMAQYAINTILYDLYGVDGYEKLIIEQFGDTLPEKTMNHILDKDRISALDYVKALAFDLVGLKFGTEDAGGQLTLGEMAVFILMSHTSGTEVDLGNLTVTEADVLAKIPEDPAYRKKFEAALIDFSAQCDSGQLVQVLLDKLLKPVLLNEDSVLKTLLGYKFDFTTVLTADEQGNMTNIFNFLNPILAGLTNTNLDLSKIINIENFVLGDIISVVLPMLGGTIQDLLGFSIVGTDILSILEGFLDDYLVDSFFVGIGGIAKAIVVSFATDETQDIYSIESPETYYLLQPYKNAAKYANADFTYVSTIDVPDSANAATQDNGRVPSRVTANFDTLHGTDTFTINFYTAEDVFGTFKYKDSLSGEWITVQTTQADAAIDGSTKFMTAKKTADNVTVTTVAKPAYIPLIDLGLLCITHGEVSYEVEKTVGKNTVTEIRPYTADMRDAASANSVIFWNVHTVTISGLDPGTTYYYDIEGNYTTSYGTLKHFPLSDYAQAEHFTFTTAKSAEETDFNFLAIADIQGMIQSMYTDSYGAMEALLDDDGFDFDLALNAGDMCDNGKNFYQWGYALDTYVDFFANKSVFMTAGNHEKGSGAMVDFFNYTQPAKYNTQTGEDGLFYSFDYGNAHFVVLNTNDILNKNGKQTLGAQQTDWLKKDLAANKKEWTFVLMHKSLYSGGSHATDAEVVGMRNTLVKIFNDYGVDIVFGGHDHTYTTTKLINAKGEVTEAVDENGVKYADSGVLFVTLGTMGTKFYEYTENDNVTPAFDEENSVLDTLDTQTFGYVSVTAATLTYKGYKYVNGGFAEISEIVLSNDAKIISDVLKQSNSEQPKSFSIGFFDKAYTESVYDASMLPSSYKLQYVANGTAYGNIQSVPVSGKSVEVEIYLLDSDGINLGLLETIEIVKDSYAGYIAMFVIIPVVVVGAAVCAIALAALKKKGKLGKKKS